MDKATFLQLEEFKYGTGKSVFNQWVFREGYLRTNRNGSSKFLIIKVKCKESGCCTAGGSRHVNLEENGWRKVVLQVDKCGSFEFCE